MALSMTAMLGRYFRKEEIQDALADIGLETTGNKSRLIGRLVKEWEPHNRNPYDLLDFLYKNTLSVICSDYALESKGRRERVKARIVEADLLGVRGVGRPGTSLTGLRRLRFHVPLIGSIVITGILYFFLPSLGFQDVSVRVASIFIFFLSSWIGLNFLEGRIRRN